MAFLFFGSFIPFRRLNGVVADILWYEIPYQTQFAEFGDFVVMPKHIHGLLIVDKPAVEPLHATVLQGTAPHVRPLPDDGLVAVGTLHARSLQSQQPPPSHEKNLKMSDVSPKPNTI